MGRTKLLPLPVQYYCRAGRFAVQVAIRTSGAANRIIITEQGLCAQLGKYCYWQLELTSTLLRVLYLQTFDRHVSHIRQGNRTPDFAGQERVRLTDHKLRRAGRPRLRKSLMMWL